MLSEKCCSFRLGFNVLMKVAVVIYQTLIIKSRKIDGLNLLFRQAVIENLGLLANSCCPRQLNHVTESCFVRFTWSIASNDQKLVLTEWLWTEARLTNELGPKLFCLLPVPFPCVRLLGISTHTHCDMWKIILWLLIITLFEWEQDQIPNKCEIVLWKSSGQCACGLYLITLVFRRVVACMYMCYRPGAEAIQVWLIKKWSACLLRLNSWWRGLTQLTDKAKYFHATYYTPASAKLKGAYTGFTLCVCLFICPFVDRIKSALYLQQYLPDPFHIYTSYQATSVSHVKFFVFFKIQVLANSLNL